MGTPVVGSATTATRAPGRAGHAGGERAVVRDRRPPGPRPPPLGHRGELGDNHQGAGRASSGAARDAPSTPRRTRCARCRPDGQDEVKRRTVRDGFARGDHRGIHRGDEVRAREHDERGAFFRSITREAQAAKEPRLELLEGGTAGQGAAGLGFDVKHHGPQGRDEHLAVTEPASTPHSSQGAMDEVSDLKIVGSRGSADTGYVRIHHV